MPGCLKWGFSFLIGPFGKAFAISLPSLQWRGQIRQSLPGNSTHGCFQRMCLRSLDPRATQAKYLACLFYKPCSLSHALVFSSVPLCSLAFDDWRSLCALKYEEMRETFSSPNSFLSNNEWLRNKERPTSWVSSTQRGSQTFPAGPILIARLPINMPLVDHPPHFH